MLDMPECERCSVTFTQEDLDNGICPSCGLYICDEGDAIDPGQLHEDEPDEVDFSD